MGLFNREKKEQDYKDLLEKLAQDNSKNLIYLLIGSLISADTLVGQESCENSIFMLTKLKESLKLVDPDYYTAEEIAALDKYCNDGLEIAQRDLEIFKET